MPSPRLAAALIVLVAACHPVVDRLPPTPAPPPTPRVTDDAPPFGRLDDRARPLAATVELAVDPRADDIGGRVAIDVAITRPLRVIWLHARGLDISDAQVIVDGAPHPARVIADPSTTHTDGQGELIGLAVDEPLLAGPARIALTYRAPWGTDAGLIRSADVGPMAVTDLSPADARSVMPCFDDPRFKIPWTVALTVPADLAAFANYPERSRRAVDAGHIRIEFEPTRPLPAHLVAFAVGALVTVDGGARPVPIRIITVAGTEATMAHAAAQVPALLSALSAYLDEPVPFPKLDVVAVPSLSGQVVGMENPGLITVRADSLAVAADAPPGVAISVTATLAHELAHLWFGDLVSLAWWDEFWLNEGFATWLTDKLMAEREPGWTMLGHPFAPWSLMSQDGPDTSPVRKPLRTLADYPAILDLKAYARGAAVVATLEAWLGPAAFRALMHGWIERHRDGSVTTDLLVEALAAAPGLADPPVARLTLSAMMAGLVDHAGVPLARFALRCDRDAPPRLEITVEHGPAAAPWPLPVCARYDGGASPRCALVTGSASLELTGACPRWIVPNPGARAYYRPVLAPGLLAAALASGAPTRDERAMLTRAAHDASPPRSLDDRLRAAITCEVDVLPWCLGEFESIVWQVVTAARRPALLARLQAMLPDDAVGFDRGDWRTRLSAAQRAQLLASLGDRRWAAAGRVAADTYLRGTDGDLFYAAVVLATAAAADARLWPRYLRHVRALHDPMASAFAVGLGSFQDRRALARIVGVLGDRRISASLRRRVLSAAFVNPALRDQRRELAARAAPLLTATEFDGELGSWCGDDDERAAAALLAARGADDDQVARAVARIAGCTADADALAADADLLR